MNKMVNKELLICNLKEINADEIFLYKLFSTIEEVDYVKVKEDKISNKHKEKTFSARVIFRYSDIYEFYLLEAKRLFNDKIINDNQIKVFIQNTTYENLQTTYSSNFISIEIPFDDEKRKFIDHIAKEVSCKGINFELTLSHEKFNSKFNFLFLEDSSDYFYYKWKVFSLSSGDEIDNWSEEPIIIGSDTIIPPKMKLKYVFKKKIDEKIDLKLIQEETRFKLQKLDNKRKSIFEFSIYFFYWSNNSNIILVIIKEIQNYFVSVVNINSIINIFYILNDIVYNSKNLFNVRKILKDHLELMINYLRTLYQTKMGMISKSGLKNKLDELFLQWQNLKFLNIEEIQAIQTIIYSTSFENFEEKDDLLNLYLKINLIELKFMADKEFLHHCKKNFISSSYEKQDQINISMAIFKNHYINYSKESICYYFSNKLNLIKQISKELKNANESWSSLEKIVINNFNQEEINKIKRNKFFKSKFNDPCFLINQNEIKFLLEKKENIDSDSDLDGESIN